MDALLDAQRGALAAWRAACAARPAVHAHQLAALAREQALCASAAGIAGYMTASGGTFELTRAAWLDRVAGRLQVALAVGDAFGAQAALGEYRGALQARGHADWSDALVAAAVQSASWQARSAAAAPRFARAMASLLAGHTGAPPPPERLVDAGADWQAVCAADPAAAPAWAARARVRCAYALRLPWDAPGLVLVARWLGALDPGPAGAPLPGEADPLAALHTLRQGWLRRLVQPAAPPPWRFDPASTSAEAPLAGYRALAEAGAAASDAASAMAVVARRALALAAGAASGAEVQRRLLEARVPAALAAAALRPQQAATAARQRVWRQPLLAMHMARLQRALDTAQTDTEVELLATHADACLAVEADWEGLLLQSALAPLRAAALARLQGAAAQAGVTKAVAVAHRLLGLGPRALLALPPVAAFVRDNLAPTLAGRPGGWDGHHGESGGELLLPINAWLLHEASRGTRAAPSQRALPGLLRTLFDAVGAPEPAPRVRSLRLWGQSHPLRDWTSLAADPPRPMVPGWPPMPDGAIAVIR